MTREEKIAAILQVIPNPQVAIIMQTFLKRCAEDLVNEIYSELYPE